MTNGVRQKNDCWSGYDLRGPGAMTVHVTREQWKNRDALRLANDLIEIVVLAGGGHLAEMSLATGQCAGINCLWMSYWPTVDPDSERAAHLVSRYGSDPAARFLAGYTGHALCLDLFGPPSPKEAQLGVALHGEAAVHPWSFKPTHDGCIGHVELPVAQLSFTRRLSLAYDSPVLLVTEHVENRGVHPRGLQWVQHLTLGPPLLDSDDSFLSASLDKCLTGPLGYEGHARLQDNASFAWPYAPELDGSIADLRAPFTRFGTGFIAAGRVSPDRDLGFIAALNFRLGLACIYCFRRQDFPWITIWEENCARTAAPWNGVVQARGMEFGTTPLPIGHDALCAMPALPDTPSTRDIAPGQVVHARYLAALVTVPVDWHSITDVQIEQDTLRLVGEKRGSCIKIRVHGISRFFKEDT